MKMPKNIQMLNIFYFWSLPLCFHVLFQYASVSYSEIYLFGIWYRMVIIMQ